MGRSIAEKNRIAKWKRRLKVASEIAKVESLSTAAIECRKCSQTYVTREFTVRICCRKTTGRLKNCKYHPQKRQQYADTVGNYSIDSNSSLILRDSLTIEGGIRSLFSSHNTVFVKGDYITTYPHNTDPTQDALNNYKIHTLKNSPDIVGLTTPVIGVGLGSFINSTWNNSGIKNCEFQYHNGVMYVVAIKFISYNTELFTTYGVGYNYETMQ
jgi:hypothetical protein